MVTSVSQPPSEKITIELPTVVIHQVEQTAKAQKATFSQVVAQVLSVALTRTPPLSEALEEELDSMQHFSNEALWQIAQGNMNPDKVAFYDLLLERLHDGSLTVEGKAWVTRLRDENDRIALRKAQALSLLKLRGHDISAAQPLGQP